jgi:hypothetical protein
VVVEVSVFVLSPEIEDRGKVDVETGRSTKRPTSEFLSSSGSQKKIGHAFYFLLLQLQ